MRVSYHLDELVTSLVLYGNGAALGWYGKGFFYLTMRAYIQR